jgi:hypothetical protein
MIVILLMPSHVSKKEEMMYYPDACYDFHSTSPNGA